MGSTLGTQTQFGSVNSAFFCQDSTLLQMSGVSSVNVEPKLAAGNPLFSISYSNFLFRG